MVDPSALHAGAPPDPPTSDLRTGPVEAATEVHRAAIWIGIEPCTPHPPGAEVPPAVTARISAFIDAQFPGAQVDARDSASFCVRCAGSLTQVMHIADDLGWHVRCLAGTDDLEDFEARLGIVIAAHGETVASLLHRAEDAAERLTH